MPVFLLEKSEGVAEMNNVVEKIRPTAQSAHEFSPDGYRQLVRQFKERGYRFCDFHNLSPDKPDIIMRHDIDLSLEYAVRLAELEADEDVKASYYVLVSSEFYNILTPSSRSALKQIVNLGHEVGLHFDASICDDAPVCGEQELETIATLECNLLEEVTGQPVRSIAFHRPAKQYQGYAGNLAGRLHSYQPRFFSEIDYCADSSGRWKYGHPLDREIVEQGKAIQLVTHPIWWNLAPEVTTVGKIEHFRQSREAHLKSELSRNLTPYAEFLRKPEFLQKTEMQ